MIERKLSIVANYVVAPNRLLKTLYIVPGVKGIATRACVNKTVSLLDRLEANGLSQRAVFIGLADLDSLLLKAQKNHFISKSKRLQLDRRIIALAARTSMGVQADPAVKVDNYWKVASETYKRSTFAIPDGEKELSDRDEAILQELIMQFPRFAGHLLENPKLQNQFFEWTILNRLPVDLFVKYVTVTKKIPAFALRHLATACPDALIESSEGTGPKQLTVRCKVVDPDDATQTIFKHVNVLKSSARVPFTLNRTPTIEKVLDQFPNTSSAKRDYQFFEDGLCFYNTSAYRGIDFDEANWWEKLPVFKTLSLEEAQRRYGDKVDGEAWILSARSAHLSDELVLSGNHSYLEMAIPQEDGSYKIYPFGRDPHRDPFNPFDLFSFLGKTTYGEIVYADQGACYLERRNTGVTVALDSDRGEAVMGFIREDIQRARAGHLPFQLAWENCAKWIQDIIDKVDTDGKIETPLFEVATRDVKGVFYKKSERWHKFIISLFGVHRSKRIGESTVSVRETPFYGSQKMHHPSVLYTNIRDNQLKTFYDLRV